MNRNGAALAEMPTEGSASRETSVQEQIVSLLPAMRAYARLLARPPLEADDLLQEALVRAIGHVHQFQPGTNLKAWLFTILRNTHLTACSKRSRETTLRSDIGVEALGAAAGQGWTHSLLRVRDALERLPNDQKELLILVCGAGFSYEEAADICECNMGTIKSRINRGRKKLARMLGIDGIHDLAGDSRDPRVTQPSSHLSQNGE